MRFAENGVLRWFVNEMSRELKIWVLPWVRCRNLRLVARFLWNMKLCLNSGCDGDDGFCCLALLENDDVC